VRLIGSERDVREVLKKLEYKGPVKFYRCKYHPNKKRVYVKVFV